MERSLDITPQQFRRKLLGSMHKKLRAELMRATDYHGISVQVITARAEAVEEALMEAGQLQYGKLQLALEDEHLEEVVTDGAKQFGAYGE